MDQYSIIHTALSQFIATYLDGGDGTIKLVPDDDAIMPHVKKKTFEIKYSYRTELLVLLQNCGCEKLLLDYFLAVTCYVNNKYDESKFFISRIKSNINENSQTIKEKYPEVKDKVIYQLLFMVLHEVGHGLFAIREDLKNFFYELVENDVKSISKFYLRLLSLFKPFYKIYMFFQKRKFGYTEALKKFGDENSDFLGSNTIEVLKQFPDYIKKPKKKEELACDLYALRFFQMTMSEKEIKEEDYKDYYTAGLNAIQFLSRYSWWDNYLVKQYDSEQAHNKSYLDPLRVIFFFNECTSVIENNYNKTYNELYNAGMSNVPGIKHSINDLEYAKELGEILKKIGEGSTTIDEQSKIETYELLLDAENDILCCVSEENIQ